MFVIIPWGQTITPRRDHWSAVLLKNFCYYLLSIISFICNSIFRFKAVDHWCSHDTVMCISTREFEPKRIAQCVHSSMNFCSQASSTAPNRLFFAAPLAPAACWWARTYEPSSIMDSKSASLHNSSKMVPHTLDLDHALKRLYTVCQGPNSSGKSRQGAPVRKIQMTPFKIKRVSVEGLPLGSLRTGRTWGSIRCHSSSVISCLLIRAA